MLLLPLLLRSNAARCACTAGAGTGAYWKRGIGDVGAMVRWRHAWQTRARVTTSGEIVHNAMRLHEPATASMYECSES